MKLAFSLVAVLAVVSTARADVWKRATGPEPKVDQYEALLARGDEAVLAASSKSINIATVRKSLDIAIEAYKAAAKTRPGSGEPWFRMATVIEAFYFDCAPDPLGHRDPPATCSERWRTVELQLAVIEAWDKFEELAPLDPRVNEILFKRAIARTKLVASSKQPEVLLRGAAKDYQAVIDREDGMMLNTPGFSRELPIGNLAETYMMLGDIERAIDLYRVVLKTAGGASTVYGLAVAFDREGRGDLPLRMIRGQGAQALRLFERDLDVGRVFFVPPGESDYYLGLAYEAFDELDDAITHWRAFIRSGAHPQFQPRAKAHLDKLMTKKALGWRPPITRELEEFPRIPRRHRIP